ncbi:MAG: TlpA family protein disulfide reductase [Myxococcaceae bacterium]|nr:TlpA family protein disulfide reductase [Myxococcaceae bacterium]
MRFLVPVAVAALAACGAPSSGNKQPIDTKAPEFEGGGQDGTDVGEDVYPGPYGVGIGSVVKNYTFYGFPRWEDGPTEMVKMSLADLYNPTGHEVFPEGSPFGAGLPKPKALMLDRSAVWCEPCNFEARVTLPSAHARYEPMGGEFILLLGEGPTGGEPATQTDLERWATKYDLDYPAAIDPNGTISEVVGKDAWPGNVIVRTKDMKIIEWTAGGPDAAFWDLFEKVLDDQPVLDGD